MYLNMQTHVNTHLLPPSYSLTLTHASTQVYTHTYIHAYIHTYIHALTHKHLDIHIYMYKYLRTYTHTHAHARTRTNTQEAIYGDAPSLEGGQRGSNTFSCMNSTGGSTYSRTNNRREGGSKPRKISLPSESAM